MSDGKPVLLTGGTAQVGLHILPALHASGCESVALSRTLRPDGPAGGELVKSIRWLHPQLFRTESVASRASAPVAAEIAGPELLLSAGPIALANDLLDICPGIRKVVCLSTSSVLTKADSSHPAERQQIADIMRGEEKLLESCSARQIDLCLLRPTLIYGCGLDENISRLAAFIRRYGLLPVAGKAGGLRQPIHVADLAALMMQLGQSDRCGQSVYTVTGGSTLSYHDMVVKIFQALGKSPRLFRLPAGVFASAVSVVGKLSGSTGLNAAMVRRQNQDLVFDDSEIRQRFDFRPREFNPGPQDFSLPAGLKDYLPAGSPALSQA